MNNNLRLIINNIKDKKLEERHFGALSGQGLVQMKLKNYEKALSSYERVKKIYPSMRSPKIMIPQIKELIKDQSV